MAQDYCSKPVGRLNDCVRYLNQSGCSSLSAVSFRETHAQYDLASPLYGG